MVRQKSGAVLKKVNAREPPGKNPDKSLEPQKQTDLGRLHRRLFDCKLVAGTYLHMRSVGQAYGILSSLDMH